MLPSKKPRLTVGKNFLRKLLNSNQKILTKASQPKNEGGSFPKLIFKNKNWSTYCACLKSAFLHL